MTLILLVGGADTGRAPMAAALLRRHLAARALPWPVESAGVLGYDGEPAQAEARDTMAHLGMDIAAHQARTLTDDLARGAALLLAIDRGTALVIQARYPEAVDRIMTLGELAGRPRDIPDPFKMQLGAWMTYAREIDALLGTALPRIIELLPPTETLYGEPSVAAPPTNPERGGEGEGENEQSPISNLQSPIAERETGPTDHGPQTTDSRQATVERLDRLILVVAQMPGVVDWAAARAQVEADLGRLGAAPRAAGDLVAAYGGLLRAALALTSAPPSAGQLAALREAIGRLLHPVGQPELNDLSAQLATWATL